MRKRSRRDIQPQPSRAHRRLAFHPPVRRQRHRDRPDARRVRARDRAAVPGRPRGAPRPAEAAVPHEHRRQASRSSSWTVRVREAGVQALPPERLLPDGQPTYVASWIYVFGVASIASLIVIIASGTILALKGPPGGTTPGRPFLQQHPPLERGAVLLCDGRSPLGQVLDGRMARRARPRVGHRRDRLPGRCPVRADRLLRRSRTSTRSGSRHRPRTR